MAPSNSGNDTYKNKKGETIKETQWHNLTVFGNLAEIAEQHLEKGKEILSKYKVNF